MIATNKTVNIKTMYVLGKKSPYNTSLINGKPVMRRVTE